MAVLQFVSENLVMNRLETALQQARLTDGMRHPVLPPYSARTVNQRAFGIHEFTASHWVSCAMCVIVLLHPKSLQLKVLASKPLNLGRDCAHILCPPFDEPVPRGAQVIAFIGGHETVSTLTVELLDSVAACVQNGGIFLILDNVTRPFGIPVARQHHLSKGHGCSSLVASFLSQIPLRVDADDRERITPRQALAAALAPGVRTIVYSEKVHPEKKLCSTSCQHIVGSYRGQITKTNERACLLCKFHDVDQPIAASVRFGKGSMLHVVLTLGNS